MDLAVYVPSLFCVSVPRPVARSLWVSTIHAVYWEPVGGAVSPLTLTVTTLLCPEPFWLSLKLTVPLAFVASGVFAELLFVAEVWFFNRAMVPRVPTPIMSSTMTTTNAMRQVLFLRPGGGGDERKVGVSPR